MTHCPECTALGVASTVEISELDPGFSTATKVYGFWDQNEDYHLHDSINHRTAMYTCSQNHTFEAKYKETCWCGWPDTPRPELKAVHSEADFHDKIEFA